MSRTPDNKSSGASAETPGAEAEVTICNQRGLHARASAKFVKLAQTFDAEIKVSKDGTEVWGSSIMGLLLLVAASGEAIRITASGSQAEEAVSALVQLVKDRFDEGG